MPRTHTHTRERTRWPVWMAGEYITKVNRLSVGYILEQWNIDTRKCTRHTINKKNHMAHSLMSGGAVEKHPSAAMKIVENVPQTMCVRIVGGCEANTHARTAHTDADTRKRLRLNESLSVFDA